MVIKSCLFCHLFMKDKFSFSDRASFSRFSQRFNTDCISEGIAGVRTLSFASAILDHSLKKAMSINSVTTSTCSEYILPFLIIPAPELMFWQNRPWYYYVLAECCWKWFYFLCILMDRGRKLSVLLSTKKKKKNFYWKIRVVPSRPAQHNFIDLFTFLSMFLCCILASYKERQNPFEALKKAQTIMHAQYLTVMSGEFSTILTFVIVPLFASLWNHLYLLQYY